ncbi:MAG: hypothetical protein AABY15_01905 [Nanoarchaeota archaeon]
MALTDKEKIELEAKLEVYQRLHVKAGDIKSGKITSTYFAEEILREINLIKEELREPATKPEKIDVIKPKYGPADTVRHTITDTPMLFTVMEVNHGRREYKLTSQNQIKPVTIIIGWGELDEK